MDWLTVAVCLISLILLLLGVALGMIKALTNVVNRGWQPDIDFGSGPEEED